MWGSHKGTCSLIHFVEMQSLYGNNLVYEMKKKRMVFVLTLFFPYTYVFVYKTMDDGGYVEPTG